MTSIAANPVTNGQSIGATAGAAATASADGDTFSAMLDDAVQGGATAKPVDTTSGPTAKPSKDTGKTDDARDPAQPLSTPPASDPSVPPPRADQAAAKPSDDDPALRPMAGLDTDSDTPPNDPPAATPMATTARGADTRMRDGRTSDPARLRSDTADTPDDPNAVQAAPPPQPAVAGAVALVPPAIVVPAAPADRDGEAETTAPIAQAAAAPATDVAAAAIQPKGTVVKPGKPGDAKAAGDDGKAQSRNSAAATLADAGTTATRSFTDSKTAAAPAIPLHGALDVPKNGSQPADARPAQQDRPDTATAPPAETRTRVPTDDLTELAGATPAPDARVTASLQAAGLAPTAGPAGTAAATRVSAQLQISHPSAEPDINALAFNIASKSDGGTKHFDIRLDPAELGRVDVRLTVDDAGKAQASLTVEKPQTLELLQKDQGHLERALKDAGLDLTQNGLSFSLKGQQQQQSNNGGNATPRGRGFAARAVAAVDSAASTVSLGHVRASDTRLDIRV
ncbi:MAG: flagellar hook-length control protein FliK [Rhizomicrobium sp.]